MVFSEAWLSKPPSDTRATSMPRSEASSVTAMATWSARVAGGLAFGSPSFWMARTALTVARWLAGMAWATGSSSRASPKWRKASWSR